MFVLIKKAISGFLRDDAIMMSAALAFYAALSLAPLLIVLVTITDLVLGGTREQLVDQLALLSGPRSRTVIQIIMDNAVEQRITGSLSAVLSGAAVLFTSTALFVHLRKSMNRIWGVEAKPGHGLFGLVRGRLLAVAMVALVGVMFALSFFFSTTLGLFISGSHPLWRLINILSSLTLFTLLFSIVFKYLPDILIRWRYPFVGAAATAFLFEIGKHGIGFYLARSGIGSFYGAAGSFVIMLIWIYYSSVIFFFGVEMTYAYTCMYGSGVTPTRHSRFSRPDDCRKTASDPSSR